MNICGVVVLVVVLVEWCSRDKKKTCFCLSVCLFCYCSLQVAAGLCDNLVTCVVRAWDFSKPMFVAPAMNTLMWDSPFTRAHLDAIQGLGVHVIPPISKKLACGDVGNGAMAEPSSIEAILKSALNSHSQQ